MSVIASQLIGKVGLEGSEKTLSGLKQIGEHTEKAESSFKKLREQVARGFEFGTGMQLAQLPGAGLDFLKDQFVDVIKLAMDHQQIMAQTNQVLKSTHDVSKMTAEGLDTIATSLSKITPDSADAVQGVENLELTFTNIGHTVFPQATQAILDVSEAMHQDLKESAVEVGKALGDPLTGMTALQRIGVTFSAQEKEQIKTMMAHNDVIGAQKVILKELATEFGGSAQAAGKTFAGQLKIAQDRVEELKIKIGTALLPILNEFLQYFEQHIMPRLDDFSNWFQQYGIPKITEFGEWFMQTGIPALQNFGGMVGTVVGDLTSFVGWLQKGGPAADVVKVALTGVGLAIAGIKTAQFVSEMQAGLDGIITNAGKMKDTFVNFLGWYNDTFLSGFKTANAEAALSVEGSAVKEEASLATVGTTAEGASLGIKGIGLAAVGALVPVLALAGAMMGLAKWLHDSGIIPDINKITGGHDVNPPWVTHRMPGTGQNSEVNPILLGHGPGSEVNPILLNRHASGILNNPMGHWGLVGEQGPEAMWIPRGASILPNGTMPGNGQGSNQTLILTIDGVQFARVIAPYTTDHMRYNLGSVGW